MVSFLLPFYFTIVCSLAADIDERTRISSRENEHSFIPPDMENVVDNKNIEISLQKMENIATSAEKSRREGILPTEHADELHSRMVEILEDITEQLKQKTNTYKFLNSKGVDRIITPIIGINHDPLKKQLLILIKTLFEVAPITTNALIPISVVDKLLDIFEHDDNLGLKAHALDILHIWLPNNPKLQARVMKLKGLEPFYNQISKLDTTVIHTLVDLFNKIIAEHYNARNNKSQRNKEDIERLQIYKTIGLIERMSTPQVCNGLLNILEGLMTFTNNDKEISPSVFGLVNNMHKFCLETYKGKAKAIEVIGELNRYVSNWHNTDILIKMGVDLTSVRSDIEYFLYSLEDHEYNDEL